MIDFFENVLVTRHILVEVSCDTVNAYVLSGEELPQHPFATIIGNDNGSTSHIVRLIPNFVFRVIRKQGAVAICQASRQAAAGRNKHPMIGVANDTDEEIIHAVEVGNTVKRFAITSDVASLNGSGRSIKRVST